MSLVLTLTVVAAAFNAGVIAGHWIARKHDHEADIKEPTR